MVWVETELACVYPFRHNTDEEDSKYSKPSVAKTKYSNQYERTFPAMNVQET